MTKKRNLLTRIAVGAGALVSGGYMVQATGCITPFLAESSATALDFCFIFDCQNGFFGGTADPCSTQTANGEVADPFFADCPTGP